MTARRQWPSTMADKQDMAASIARHGERMAARAEAAADVLCAVVIGIALAAALASWWAS